MTILFTRRRRAEEFATAVDGGASSTDAHHAEVARLVGVVNTLRAHPDPTPRPEFTGQLRERLMTEAQQALTAENAGLALPGRVRGGRERRLVAAASAVVFIGGTAGLAAAAQDALPGEALYPVKRGIERAEAGLSLSPAGKGQDLLAQATDRLKEVSGLLAEDSPQSIPQVPETLAEFSVQATEGADLLLGSYEETGDPGSVVQVRTFAADGIELLGRLAEDVPPEARDELATAAVTLRDIDARASGLCGSCAAGLPDLTIPGLILARNEVDRAMDLVPASGLDNSHPVVVPRGTVSRVPDGRSTGQAGQPPEPDTNPTAPGAPAEIPSPGLDPGDLPTDLPDTDPTVSAGPKQPVKDPTGGLGGAVETLLPDPDLDNPLP